MKKPGAAVGPCTELLPSSQRAAAGKAGRTFGSFWFLPLSRSPARPNVTHRHSGMGG